MINNKKVLAIIPARGGSKRLPKKNILPLAGKPLIGWTIEAALKCSFIDRVIVSTDCHDIGSISKSFGAEVPFYRPDDLSSDFSTSIDVVFHSIESLSCNGWLPEIIILLQPTSPLRSALHIENAFKLYKDKKASNIVSVCEMEHSPLWCNTLPSDLSLNNYLPKEIVNTRSQDIETYYRLNGAIYLADVASLTCNKSFFPDKGSYAYIMPVNESIDIDVENDFRMAEFYLDRL
jgi:CMP-N-acetylneuraminic acid synthetase